MARSRSKEARKAAAEGQLARHEIDIADAEVAKWHKSKKQRAHEKAEARKEKERRGKAAQERLATQTAVIEKHQEQKQTAKKSTDAVRNERKRKLNGERSEARRKRTVVANAKERSIMDYQAFMQDKNAAEQQNAIEKNRKSQNIVRQRILDEERLYEERKARGEDVTTLPKNTHHVQAHRTEEMEYNRRLLPILNVEQEIVEAVNDLTANALMLCGETGSGKTTQIPQFLWEAGYSDKSHPIHKGMIGITQPRRVAARSIAKRVAEELNVGFGEEVGYQVRYENNVSDSTKVKFMTEGILLKEIQSDIALRQYSVIIIDEAHERSVATDMLLGLLTRVVRLRWEEYKFHKRGAPLKLIVMSATLQVSSLSENKILFPIPPQVIMVEARQFPVVKHFARKTQEFKYVQEAAHKVRQIHTGLPPGGILVFMPTQRTIEQTVQLVESHFSKNKAKYSVEEWGAKQKVYMAKKDKALNEVEDRDQEKDEFGMTVDEYELPDMFDDTEAKSKPPVQRDDFLSVQMDVDDDGDEGEAVNQTDAASAEECEEEEGEEDEEEEEEEEGEEEEEEEEGLEVIDLAVGGDAEASAATEPAVKSETKHRRGGRMDDGVEIEEEGEYDTVHVLPLFALLSPKLQNRVFEEVPKGKRLVVVATNIAETSLTIPGIKYVVDSGREKTRTYNAETGIAKYEIKWVSKASAEQRAGRAGRTAPGHVYRLFSTAVYANECQDHQLPEILTSPLDSIILFIKSFWRDVSVLAFPFPSPPPVSNVKTSLTHLARIGALTETTDHFEMSSLGEAVSRFPILPRYAKMLVLAKVLMDKGPTIEALRWLRGIVPMSASSTQAEIAALVGQKIGTSEMKSLFSTIINVVCIASSMMDVFVAPPNDDKEAKEAFKEIRKQYRSGSSDYLTGMNVLMAFSKVKKQKQRQAWCEQNHVSYKNLNDALDLRKQLSQLLVSEEGSIDLYASVADEEEVTADKHAEKTALLAVINAPPKALSLEGRIVVMQLIVSGLIDNVARIAQPDECEARKIRVQSGKRAAYIQVLSKEIVYIHPTSTVDAPEWVVYTSLQTSAGKQEKTTMKGVTAVRKEWLEQLGWTGV